MEYHVNLFLGIVFCFSLTNCVNNNENMEIGTKETIKKIIEKAYIEGVHISQDENLAKSGFSEDFNMLVLKDNKIDKVNIEEWFIRVEKMKSDNPKLWRAKTTSKIELIDVSGKSAVAKLKVYKGQTNFSTDYMLLYKFDDGWKIVSKIFDVPGH